MNVRALPWLLIHSIGALFWAYVGWVGTFSPGLGLVWWAAWGAFAIGYLGQYTSLEQAHEGLRGKVCFWLQVLSVMVLTLVSDWSPATGVSAGSDMPRLFARGPGLFVLTATRSAPMLGLRGGLLLVLFQTGWAIACNLSLGAPGARFFFPWFGALQFIFFSYAILAQRQRILAVELEESVARLKLGNAFLALSERREQRADFLRDLHDSAGHFLTGLSLNLQTAMKTRGEEQKVALRTAEETRRELVKSLQEFATVRRRNLEADVRALLEVTRASFGQGSIVVDIRLGSRPVPPLIAEALYRCAQEGLTNSLRHSGARSILFSLVRSAGRFDLRIEDDGDGRSPSAQKWFGLPGLTVAEEGQGLPGIRQRVAALSGTVRIRDLEPRGFSLEVTVPDDKEER